MATWTFNSGSANSPYGDARSAITPQQGATINGGQLSSTGNVLNVQEAAPRAKSYTFAGQGVNWSARINSGVSAIPLVWVWDLHADSEDDMNLIETGIREYFTDGGEYVLSDGLRSGKATIVQERSGRVGVRRELPDGKLRQIWRLTFQITRPKLTATEF